MKLSRALIAAFPVVLLLPRAAEAHFRLTDPPSWVQEGALGDPQKSAPCGGEGNPTLTNTVTRFRPGQTITVRVTETIFHPGHWRIAIAENRADLHDPMVTVDANGNAASATIVDPPVLPILADGIPVHGPPNTPQAQEFTVTLPNMTCAHCTLQVIQFMRGHGPPTFIYHHCADVELAADAPDAGPVDLGMSDAGGVAPPEDAMVVIDTGVAPTDTGVAPTDTGVEPADMGVVDTGATPMDSGVVAQPDAGQTIADSGSGGADGGAKDPKLSGCGCSDTGTSPAEVALGLAAFVFFGAARRYGKNSRTK